ncbi:MAG: hypothetical protein Q7S58_09820 [Candidatus Binatus sp.]|uniref:tyrosine-protein kinase family protein n=1 Tax=Candidatus Binatus sp. TaxID=2811406 RepID=UPI002721EE9D|nr:hypothetical protein [Candidatus Binatus sp.]MDO8432693.1 hypothetical protein [Candidatus Binatus sp.]
MSKFFGALQQRAASPPGSTERLSGQVRTVRLSLVPNIQAVAAELARDEGLYHLAEQFSALASVTDGSRLFVAGCNPGDGASSVAAAIALDLSQRLGLPTALVDAHLQHPGLQNVFPRNDTAISERSGSLIRNTGLPRLDLMLNTLGQATEQLIQDVNATLPRYRAAVVDLGVARLDPSLLRLIRPADIVMLVARYGHTERRHLLGAVRAFTAANHPAIGVIFNAVQNPIPEWLRRIIGIGG